MKKLLALSALFFSACAAAPTVTLVPNGPGVAATGSIDPQAHTMTVNLAGKVYSGPMTVMRAKHVGVIAGELMVTRSRQGDAQAILAAADGSHITCRFIYQPRSGVGMGDCSSSDGRTYTLQTR